MNLMLITLLLQTLPMPSRSALDNPGTLTEMSKSVRSDYDKIWAHFVSGSQDSTVIRDADKLLKKQTDFVPALIVQAYVDIYAGRNNDAQLKLDQVRVQQPANPIALYYLGELAFAKKDYQAATDIYGRLYEMNKSRSDLEMKRQRALLLAIDGLVRDAAQAEQTGELVKAEALYRQLVQDAPNEPRLYGL